MLTKMSLLGLKHILSSVERRGKVNILKCFKVHLMCTSSTTGTLEKNVRVRFAPSPTGKFVTTNWKQ